MSQIGRRFSLSEQSDHGVFCSGNGVFVGGIPLLVQDHGPGNGWHPRPASDLSRDLSKRYGLPVEFDRKIDALGAVAGALGRGDLIHAQIATLHLEIPEPLPLAKSMQTQTEIIDLARRLRASGLLKEDWDPAKHPRWPAGSSGGIGGEFAPTGTASGDSAAGQPSAPVIPAQITIPVPFELPGRIPFPSEIVPPPALPDIFPRQLRNPYPDRPECEEEWAEALKDCDDLRKRGLLGKDGYRGMGDFYQCVMGRVSERCGGFSTGI
jgi:hypothetical protein